MIRKWTKILLSLMLALMLPLTAMADLQNTASIVLGDVFAVEEAITDLLDALTLRLTQGDESGALTVLLNNNEIVTVGLTADVNGLYVDSELLGEDVVYISWEDGFAFLNEMLAASMADVGLDEETLQGMQASLAEMQNGVVTAIENNYSATMEITPEKIQETVQLAEEMFPNDPAMVAFIKGTYDGVSIEKGQFPNEDRDTADQMYRMTMDAEDLAAICETNYLKTVIKETLAAEMPEASEEELAQAVEEVIAEVKKICAESSYEMIMEMYTVDQGETLVGLDMTMNMLISDEEQSYPIQMYAEFDRLTNENGRDYKADGGMMGAEFSFELHQAKGISKGMLGILAEGEEVVIVYNARPEAGTRVRKYDLYLRSDASAILEPSPSDRPAITLNVLTEKASEQALEALNNAAPDNSLNVLKLSEEELMAYGEQVAANAVQVLYAALAELPTSTLELLTNGGI